jgi:hypothetical protein
VVATFLSLVNQGDVLAMGMGTGRIGLKIAFNNLIPYVTSSTGALLALRYRPDRDVTTGPGVT